MKNLIWMWALGLLPGLFGTAVTAGSAITSNPLMLMMLMGGGFNIRNLLMVQMLTGQSVLGGTGTNALLPLMLLSGGLNGGSRRRSRRSRPQTVYVRNRRY